MSEPVDYIDRVTIRGQTYYFKDSTIDVNGLPTPTPELEGAFLRIKNGAWVAEVFDEAEGGIY